MGYSFRGTYFKMGYYFKVKNFKYGRLDLVEEGLGYFILKGNRSDPFEDG